MAALKKNLGYQSIYFVISTMVSIIIAPYISRVLGAENLGIFSYSASIVAYFELIAALGFSSYGARSIAEVARNRVRRSKVFSSILFLQIIMASLAIGLYSMYVMWFCELNQIVAIAQGLILISALVDINWAFRGMEDFKFISIRNIFIRVGITISIFLFVKSKDDLIIYVILMALQILLANIMLWFRIFKYMDIVKCSIEEIFIHLKPNFILTIPIAAMVIYSLMDKTMLGLMSSYNQTGYYYNADLLISALLRGTVVVNGVMSPRMASLISHEGKLAANKLFEKSYNIVAFLFIGAAFGVAGIAKEFVPLYFGAGFEECIILLIFLTPTLAIKACGSTIRQQYLIPNKKDKLYAMSNTAAMIVNLMINALFIVKLGALGAVIGTVVAEFVSFVIPIVAIRYELQIVKIVKDTFIYIINGFLMFISIRFIANSLGGDIKSLVVEIIVGGMIYISLGIITDFLLKRKNLLYILNSIGQKK